METDKKHRVVIIDHEGVLKEMHLDSVTDFIFLPDLDKVSNEAAKNPGEVTVPTTRYKLRGSMQIVNTIPIYSLCSEEEFLKETTNHEQRP